MLIIVGCIALSAAFAQAYADSAIAAFGRKDYDKAIVDYTQAIRIAPKFATAYGNRASAYGMKGEYDKAIADLEAALRIDPNHANANRMLEFARWMRARFR
jgi:tetratricopeptide (TPR) repeat protein